VTEHVLSTRRLNRAVLARQLLLDRSPLPLPEALEQVAGLQTQYAPSGYVGLWSRLKGFRRRDLTEALEQRRVVQATMMRSTIHMVSAGDFWPFVVGTRGGRRVWWLRTHGRQEDLDMEAVAACLRAELAGGPRRRAELTSRLRAEGFPDLVWSWAGLWVEMVRVPPSGTWQRRRADLYGLAEDWLGPPAVTEAEGLEHLVRRYLGGFGPASMKDVAGWAGLTPTAVRPAVAALELRRFRDEEGRELLDLPGAPLPDPETPAPVRFLPTWDATLLVHARRAQILPEAYRSLVFDTKTPHSVPTFLVDGAVAGSWRYEGGRITLHPFGPIPRAARREAAEEAERLSELHEAPGT
jgi:hypothetical protein